jgi:hypothetical protein
MNQNNFCHVFHLVHESIFYENHVSGFGCGHTVGETWPNLLCPYLAFFMQSCIKLSIPCALSVLRRIIYMKAGWESTIIQIPNYA